jgi:redox-sensitive bicupin YhaK (pirin superfamily)
MSDDSQSRNVVRVVDPQAVVEGAGVRLVRTIASWELDYLDPFLLLDDFRSDRPNDYLAGFPWHPHRGIETVTTMLAGQVQHRDSIGNAGTIRGGDVQWMTAGRGIMHEEMPQPLDGQMGGFQLWVNLPARLKMTQPRYQDVPAVRIPVVQHEGTTVRVITGESAGVTGPVTEIYVQPTYLDVTLAPHAAWTQPVPAGHTAFAYVFEGEGLFGGGEGMSVRATRLAIFGDGDQVAVRTGDQPVRFLFVAGQPLNEPVARYGPFVMNTRAEIEQALQDLRDGTFVAS